MALKDNTFAQEMLEALDALELAQKTHEWTMGREAKLEYLKTKLGEKLRIIVRLERQIAELEEANEAAKAYQRDPVWERLDALAKQLVETSEKVESGIDVERALAECVVHPINTDTCGVCGEHFAECEEHRASHGDPPFTAENTFPACPGARGRALLAKRGG